MPPRSLKSLSSLEIEEKVLNAASFIALIGVFFPWLGGEWLGGDSVTYTGFHFYTSFLGIAIVLLHFFVLAITAVPLFGGPVIVRKRHRNLMRLLATSQAVVLTFAALSVLIKVTFEFSRVEVRFGIYVTLIGSLVAALYSPLRYSEQRRQEGHDLFHHPEDTPQPSQLQEHEPPLPPPPPPPPLEPEEHRLR